MRFVIWSIQTITTNGKEAMMTTSGNPTVLIARLCLTIKTATQESAAKAIEAVTMIIGVAEETAGIIAMKVAGVTKVTGGTTVAGSMTTTLKKGTETLVGGGEAITVGRGTTIIILTGKPFQS